VGGGGAVTALGDGAAVVLPAPVSASKKAAFPPSRIVNASRDRWALMG
jgi:hypothetical protein